VAYIDFNKCRLCRKCVDACPTKAIHAVNFPAPKPVEPVKEEKEAEA
jgi:formate hydrogenlyase subunit 6/NADH:ubiquinone oxidoreductase subunit I